MMAKSEFISVEPEEVKNEIEDIQISSSSWINSSEVIREEQKVAEKHTPSPNHLVSEYQGEIIPE